MKKENKNFDIIAIGGATRDIMFYSGEGELIKTGNLTKQKLLAFEYGAKILADKLFFSFGGGAANAAVEFANLGLKAAIVCRVGEDDNGKLILKNFVERHVATDFVKMDKKSATGFSVILTADNIAKEHVAFLHRGANENLSALDLPFAGAKAKWLYISSLPKAGWEGVMLSAEKSGAKIAWNPGSRQLSEIIKLKKYLPKTEILIMNRDEAEEFRKLKDIKGLLKHIWGLGPKIAVITDGEKGAYAFDGKKYYFMKAKATKPADTVGVGDAFGSAFTSAIFYGKNIRQALEWGIKNSASTIAKVGAQNGLLNLRQISR